MLSSDILLELEGLAQELSGNELHRIAFWHTHPQGNVGPSAGDMRDRIEGASYLVVALQETEAIPCWF